MESCWKNLAEIVAPENLTLDTECLRRQDWEGPLPQAIAYPGSREQVGEIMRLAYAERWRVAPAGHGTKQRMGGVPRPIDLVLSLQRLNQVTDYQAADLTISVEAGLRLQDLSATLRGKGQMVPLDAPFTEEATVGGALATNASGPRRLAYGSLRDMVIGVHFVTSEGKRVKSGGKVVKNVAGYDMAKLLIGSLGTLGIITDVAFKVFPIPLDSATLILGFATAAQALQARHHILNSPLVPQAMDLLDASSGRLAGLAEVSGVPYSLVVGAAGPEAVTERFRQELPLLARENGLETVACLTAEPELNLWTAIRELSPHFLRAQPDGAVVKASVLLGDIGGVLAQADQLASDNGLALATLARAGTGIVYCYLWPQPETDRGTSAERMASACESVLAEADRLGGRALVEWCPTELKQRINIWGALKDDFPLMQRLKAQLDPLGILNPGRFYGGI